MEKPGKPSSSPGTGQKAGNPAAQPGLSSTGDLLLALLGKNRSLEMWSQLWINWWRGTISSLHFLCPCQRKPISTDVGRTHDISDSNQNTFLFFNAPGMSGHMSSCSHNNFPNSLCLQPLPPQPECAAAHEPSGTAQLGKLRKRFNSTNTEI